MIPYTKDIGELQEKQPYTKLLKAEELIRKAHGETCTLEPVETCSCELATATRIIEKERLKIGESNA